MYEIKNKKTGISEMISDEDYEKFSKSYIANRFTATKMNIKPLIPSLRKEIIVKKEEKTKIKKNEG